MRRFEDTNRTSSSVNINVKTIGPVRSCPHHYSSITILNEYKVLFHIFILCSSTQLDYNPNLSVKVSETFRKLHTFIYVMVEQFLCVSNLLACRWFQLFQTFCFLFYNFLQSFSSDLPYLNKFLLSFPFCITVNRITRFCYVKFMHQRKSKS